MKSIEEHFQGLKSSSSKVINGSFAQGINAYDYGIHCEKLAALHYFNLGHKLLAHRYRCKFSEIDLIFMSKNKQNFLGNRSIYQQGFKGNSLILLEVKSLSKSHWGLLRLSVKQKVRLQRARQYFESKLNVLVEFHLVYVLRSGAIKVIKHFL